MKTIASDHAVTPRDCAQRMHAGTPERTDDHSQPRGHALMHIRRMLHPDVNEHIDRAAAEKEVREGIIEGDLDGAAAAIGRSGFDAGSFLGTVNRSAAELVLHGYPDDARTALYRLGSSVTEAKQELMGAIGGLASHGRFSEAERSMHKLGFTMRECMPYLLAGLRAHVRDGYATLARRGAEQIGMPARKVKEAVESEIALMLRAPVTLHVLDVIDAAAHEFGINNSRISRIVAEAGLLRR